MEIFIGSSRESLDLARDIAIWLEERGHQAVPWDQPGLFPPGEQTMKVLVDLSQRVGAAILVFSADDQVWYRGDAMPAPRDNVLIEYGLFAGALGPQRAIVCRDGDPRHPVDLAGLQYVDLSPARRERGKIELSIWARRLTTNSPVDPAMLQLRAQVAVLEQEKEELNRRLEFESDKAQDLTSLLHRANVADFSRYDLNVDGHWKLLFDFGYFHRVASSLARAAVTPVELLRLLDRAGASKHTEQVAWHPPGSPHHRAGIDTNPARTDFLARKVLRLFRRNPKEAESFTEFVAELPAPLGEEIDETARQAILRLGTT